MLCYNCMEEFDGEGFCPNCGFLASNYKLPTHHLITGSTLFNRYLVGTAIGEGGFGITYIGYDKTLQKKVAIKEFYMVGYVNRINTISQDITTGSENYAELFETNKNKFISEARVLAKFDEHMGIVKIKDYFEENNTAYIIMSFMDGGTLKQYIRTHGLLKWKDTVALFMPIMKLLIDVHKSSIIHRDISPDNLMFDSDNQLNLLDFGAAREVSEHDTKSMSVILKPGFAPTEQYTSKGQGPWSDVYALCATMYYCISGKLPQNALDRIIDDELIPLKDLVPDCDPVFSDIISKGMAVHRTERYQDMAELYDSIKNLTPPAVNKSVQSSDLPKEENKEEKVQVENSPDAKPHKPGLHKRAVVIVATAAIVIIAVLCALFLLPKNAPTPGSTDISSDTVTGSPTDSTTDTPVESGDISANIEEVYSKPRGAITTANIRLYASDSTDSDIITILFKGQQLSVLAQSPNGLSKVRYNEGDYFVETAFLAFYDKMYDISSLDADIYSKGFAGVKGETFLLSKCTFNGENGNVFASYSRDSDVIGTVYRGQEFYVLEDDVNGYIKIKYGDGIGYVKPQYFSIDDAVLTLGTQTATLSANYRLYKSDSTESVRSNTIESGAEVTILEIQQNGWCRVMHDETEGYIESQFLNIINTSKILTDSGNNGEALAFAGASGDTITIKKAYPISNLSGICIRSSASPTSLIIGLVQPNQEFYVIEENVNGYAKVKYGERIGYIDNSVLSFNDVELTLGTQTVTVSDGASIHASDSAKSDLFGVASKGDTVTILEIQQNGWVRILYNDDECFIELNHLIFSVW